MTLLALEPEPRYERPPALEEWPPSPDVANPGPGPGAPVGYGRLVVRAASVMVALLALVFVANVVVVSALVHRAAQTRLFDAFRGRLALGVAPVGPVDANGRLLRPGTPVALIDIPRVHVHEVVVEGTTSAVMTSGPGHLRTTVLPGQPGTSVIFGRAAAFGGPFGDIGHLRPGDRITVVTGIGQSEFKVIDRRRGGDPLPPAVAPGGSRLTLVTATGFAFMPAGLQWVDADLVGTPQASSQAGVASVPPSERPLAGDTSDLWALVLELQGLTLLVVGAVACWRWWGRAQTWIVFFPLLVLASFEVSNQVLKLLPNVM